MSIARAALLTHVCACAVVVCAAWAGSRAILLDSQKTVSRLRSEREAAQVQLASAMARKRPQETANGASVSTVEQVLAAMQRSAATELQIQSVSIENERELAGTQLQVSATGRYILLKRWLSEAMARHENLGLRRMSVVRASEPDGLTASFGFVLIGSH